MSPRPLTAERERVIVHKGTEPPFSGAYWNHHAEGRYLCARCGTALFESTSKFDSGCGWPSFDEALPGAVRELPDADGRRTEIVCATCGGHLGQVFVGEGFTPKDTRHCVNSLSLEFEPARQATAPLARAYFAGGCFWGVEHLLAQEPGVRSVVCGYMGGSVDNPTYAQVRTGTTGHVETVEVHYDPAVVGYAALARRFFEIHDPTQADGQGPDIGPQYRSVVFVTSEAERSTVAGLIGALRERGHRVATRIEDAVRFFPAEHYHQNYYARMGKQPYCHARVRRFGD